MIKYRTFFFSNCSRFRIIAEILYYSIMTRLYCEDRLNENVTIFFIQIWIKERLACQLMFCARENGSDVSVLSPQLKTLVIELRLHTGHSAMQLSLNTGIRVLKDR